MKINNIRIMLIMLIIGVVLTTGCIQIELKEDTSKEVLEPEYDAPEEVFEQEYIQYGPGVYRDDIIILEEQYLFKSDALPKEFIIDNQKIVVEKVAINDISIWYKDKPSFYLLIHHNNTKEHIGFSYNRTTSIVAGMKLKCWETTLPKNIEEIADSNRICLALHEISYEEDTNDWNYIKFGTQAIQKLILPFTEAEEQEIQKCISDLEAKNMVPDNWNLAEGEISYVSGELVGGYYGSNASSKTRAEDVLRFYNLDFEDYAHIGYKITVPARTEFEWKCKLEQTQVFKWVELSLIGTSGHT